MRAIAVVAILLAGILPRPGAAQDPQPTFRAESELVVLHVSVRDRGGRYVTGLTRDDFVVIDNGRPQSIEMFSADEVPASVAVLVDNSNSMRPNREQVITAAVEFARHSHPLDEIFVLTFNDQVRHAWGPTRAGETDPGRFASAMSQAIVAHGMTAIYDGLTAGLQRLSAATHTRQVLIVVSDGGDNASRASRDDTLARVHQSDAVVYSVILTDPLMRDGNPRLMRRLAQATGGEAFHPRRSDAIDDAFARIARDIRSAYTLGYAPTTTAAADDRRHTVRVYVRMKDGRQIRVRTRDGYFERAGATP